MDQRKNLRIALISPQKGSYSESFIKAQKELLPFEVFYYYKGNLPSILEGTVGGDFGGRRVKNNFRIKRSFGLTSLNFTQYKVAESFKKNKIDVVLAQYGPTGEAIWQVCQELNLPLIVHFHGYDAGMTNILEKYQNYQESFAYATKVICVSRAMENKLLELGCPKEKLIYNVYGPNDAFLKIESDFSQPHFIGVGRFTDKKAPYYTILAFAKVLDNFPEARLTIGGDGALFNMCKNLVTYLDISHAVSLPGVVSAEAFRKYIEFSIAFVQHSVVSDCGDWEGTPLSVLEASAAGLPVVSTKHAGIPDVILEGETGILVNEHDVDGMAAAMIRLLEDKTLAMKMGKAGKERIRNNYLMDRYINQLSQIIEEATNL